jgi:hypothetical protein
MGWLELPALAGKAISGALAAIVMICGTWIVIALIHRR